MKKIVNVLKNIFFFFISFIIIVLAIVYTDLKNSRYEINDTINKSEQAIDSNSNNKQELLGDLKKETNTYNLTVIKATIVKNKEYLEFKATDFVINPTENNLIKNNYYSINKDKLKERDDFTDSNKIDLITLIKGDVVYITVTTPTILNNSYGFEQISSLNVVRIDNTYKIKRDKD